MSRERLLQELRAARDRVAELERTQAASQADYFRIIIDHSPAIIFITDAQGVFQLSAGASLAALGLMPGQVVGMNAFEVYRDDPLVLEGLRTALGGSSWSGQIELGAAHFDVFFSPHYGPGGEVKGLLGMAIDITERRRAQIALVKSQQRLTRAQKVAQLGFVEWTLADPVIQSSDEVRRILGMNDPTLPPLDQIRDLVHPDDQSSFDTWIAEVRGPSDRDPPSVEYRIRRIDGTQRVAQFWAQVDRDAAGLAVRVLGTVQDVTESHAAQEKLRQSEERLRVAFDATADYLLVLDLEHRIEMINRIDPALKPEQIIGQHLYETVEGVERIRVKEALDRAVQTRERQHYDTVFRPGDSRTLHFNSIASPIIVQGKVQGTLVSSRDVTDRIRLEQDKAQIEQEYRHSQKMEAIGRLAGGVAHDFNNVLCAITGHADLVLSDLPNLHPMRESLEEIAKAANRAAELTRQLLAFSRKQVVAPRVVDLGELVDGLRSMLVRLIGEDIRLETLAVAGGARVRADPGQLEQAVVNLVINARDAMPSGGSLTLDTRTISVDEAFRQKFKNVRAREYVSLSVIDSGCGVSAEIRDKIFEPFFTTKQLGQGTGLGLATVFGIVEQNEGYVEVSSQEGVGSTFTVYFPQVGDAVDEVRSAPEGLPQGGSETILVVEDEDMVRALAERLLQRGGYRVISAASGAEALAHAEANPGVIDLLLTDVVMPNMNGAELAGRIAETQPTVAVLYTSGYTDDVIAHHGVLDEGIEFLAKPYSVTSLSSRVRQVLDQRAAIEETN